MLAFVEALDLPRDHLSPSHIHDVEARRLKTFQRFVAGRHTFHIAPQAHLNKSLDERINALLIVHYKEPILGILRQVRH